LPYKHNVLTEVALISLQPHKLLNVHLPATQEYYGKTLQKSEDLKTNACCTAGSPLNHIKEAISNIHPDVIAKYYGCGFCVPDEV